MRNEVYTALRDLIVTGELTPGEKLRDQDIAAHLGVSRTPVREALRRLEDERLVETAANRYTRVSPLSPAQASEVYPVIERLEGLALELAFKNLGKTDFKRLKMLNQDMRAALRADDVQSLVEADDDFHEVFISQSANPELRRLLASLKVKYRRLELAYFGNLSNALASLEEHEAFIQALANGDLSAAKRALALNWRSAQERLS